MQQVVAGEVYQANSG